MAKTPKTWECPKCGGDGGEPGANFGDHGWHPCYHCCNTGRVNYNPDLINNLGNLLDRYGALSLYQFGRNLYKYTPCGPWVVFIVRDIKTYDVYYESTEHHDFDFNKCEGIKIGSIVEGSDVEVGPVELKFPFHPNELEQALNDINHEADFYWRRDNTDELPDDAFYC